MTTIESTQQQRVVSPPPQDNAYWTALFSQEQEVTPIDIQDLPRVSDMPASLTYPHVNGANGFKKEQSVQKLWERAKGYLESDKQLELPVTGYNKGGLLVNWDGLQGFVPASQLKNLPHFHIESERIRELKRRQGKLLNLKIIEIDRPTNRLILSERTADVSVNDRQDILKVAKVDDKLSGIVTNLTKFGAFIDLGGLEGLIHISELSWGRVEHPSDILSAGEAVEVVVLSVDHKRERIALSLKRLKNNPWQNLSNRFQKGQIITGTISNIVHFGAFLQVEEGLEGLIHISELAEGAFLHPNNVVRLGQVVKVRILEVDGRNRRLPLSLRRIGEES